MPRPRSPIPLAPKTTVQLYEGDYAALGGLFPTMGAAKAIRLLVRAYINRCRAAAKPIDLDELPEVAVEDLG